MVIFLCLTRKITHKKSTLHDFSDKIYFYRWKKLKQHVLSLKNDLTTLYLWHHIWEPWKLTITEFKSKCALGMKEQLLKTSGADLLSSRKKLRKILWRGRGWVGGIHPPPLIISNKIAKCFSIIVTKSWNGHAQYKSHDLGRVVKPIIKR